MRHVSAGDIGFRISDAPKDSRAGEIEARFWDRFDAGEWEPETLTVIDRFVTPETTVIDVGAWVGPFSLYVAHRCRQVYAFEPDPVAYARFEANLAANEEVAGRIEAIHAAVADEEGTLRLGVRHVPGSSETSALAIDDSGETWTVPAIRLDSFLRDRLIQDPLFIKIDIEGYEYDLLPALMPHLEGREYTLYISTHHMMLWREYPGNSLAARVLRRLKVMRRRAMLLWSLRRAAFSGGTDLERLKLGPTAARLLRGKRLTPDLRLVVTSSRHSAPSATSTDPGR